MTWKIPANIMSSYVASVEAINSDEDSFNNFRRNANYGRVVGAVTNLQGRRDYTVQLFNWISENYPEIFEDIENLKVYDSVGNPYLEEFEFNNSTIKISASTLRYLYPALRLREEFTLDTPINVVELGVGYGGMASIMNHLFDISSYQLVDLPQVETLSHRYLKEVGADKVKEKTEGGVDLFISEYCLSEFDYDKVEYFYNEYIKNSNNFYIASNYMGISSTQLLPILSRNHVLKVLDVFPADSHPCNIIYGVKK